MVRLRRVSAPHAGVFRWAVKTGTDTLARIVDVTAPTQTTVEAMQALPQPARIGERVYRMAPVEQTVYQLTATLRAAHLEADGDYHLWVEDAAGRSLVCEIPDPRLCGSSAWLVAIAHSRGAFDALFGPLGGGWIRPHRSLVLTGVGFFDDVHGQAGCAPNGIELHPVLSLLPVT